MRLPAVFVALLFLVGCAVNPVTGERELSLVDERWELQTGEQYYAPLRQSQGGDFVLKTELVAYVKEVGQRVAAESDRDLPYEFEIINSSVPNAWALPGGKISINRGLLTEMGSEAELAAVLGHEVVHAAARHSARAQSRAVLTQSAVVLGGIAVGVATEREDYASVAMLGGMLGAQLITQRYSRDAEREADYYGMIYMHRAGYDPQGAVDLMESFLRLSEGRDPGFMAGLFASHPPSRERVENNRRTLADLGAGGEVGRDRYQQAIAGIKALEPAYEAHDKGRLALQQGDHEKALARAEEALALEDGEPTFHALRGDALASLGRYADAESAYSSALARDESWFYQHLRRGMVRERLGELSGARSDLRASIDRLETAEGHYHLGNVERASGNRQQAVKHYRTAAQSDGDAGRRARQALADMGVE
ncbi:M48 family metalloprotease [Wenzhouxiangella sp. AB-CW3]|uniref:M48 family metalloprotease n=1 Tax=Wenzhouxiangella sp. AB-CW3 TaxID=2771012 RepID=UPI00168BEA99|nr:M48 family metalloprotease [Wenzhouxiangella sp. AB-CW3]QOC21726.1 M48 family metalloprotease [Wenzhouxiangella sp. AB-CW3]